MLKTAEPQIRRPLFPSPVPLDVAGPREGGRQWRCESLPPLPLPLLSIPAALVLIRRRALRARRWLLSHPLMVSEGRAGERLEVRNACVWDTGRAAPTRSALLNVTAWPDSTHGGTHRDPSRFTPRRRVAVNCRRFRLHRRVGLVEHAWPSYGPGAICGPVKLFNHWDLK